MTKALTRRRETGLAGPRFSSPIVPLHERMARRGHTSMTDKERMMLLSALREFGNWLTGKLKRAPKYMRLVQDEPRAGVVEVRRPVTVEAREETERLYFTLLIDVVPKAPQYEEQLVVAFIESDTGDVRNGFAGYIHGQAITNVFDKPTWERFYENLVENQFVSDPGYGQDLPPRPGGGGGGFREGVRNRSSLKA